MGALSAPVLPTVTWRAARPAGTSEKDIKVPLDLLSNGKELGKSAQGRAFRAASSLLSAQLWGAAEMARS